MMSSPWRADNAVDVTIRPPFGTRAKAVMARSISGASRRLTALTSTPSEGDGLDDGELADSGCYGGVSNDGRTRHARRDLLEHLQPLAAQTVFELEKTGRVAARPRQALDKTGADRVGDNREHDRPGARRLQQRRQARIASGEDDVRR
jgi:hypothetical protein